MTFLQLKKKKKSSDPSEDTVTPTVKIQSFNLIYKRDFAGTVKVLQLNYFLC